MTNEEKVESYIRENVCNKERVLGSQSVCSDKAIRECNECGNFCYFAKINRKSFLDGLDEGRKEVYEELKWVTDTDNYIVSKLERLKELEKEIEQLKKKNKQLEEDYGVEICKSWVEGCSQERMWNKEEILECRKIKEENAELKNAIKDRANMIKKRDIQIESLKGELGTLISANQQLNSMIKVKDECSREYIEQIEKMKCCGNCCHWLDEEQLGKLSEEMQLKYQECTSTQWCDKCYKWKLAEKES